MSSQYGELRPLTAEIGSGVCSTPANFNGFRVLASLLHRRLSTEVNQTLHNVWTSPALVHYIYTFRGSCPLTEFCHVQNWLCVQVLRSPLFRVIAQHSSSGRQPSCGVQQRATPVFGRAAIMLGIDPNSSSFLTMSATNLL